MNKVKVLLFLVMLMFAVTCFTDTCCMAVQKTVRLTYEQLTQRYPSMVDYTIQARRKIKNNWYPPVASFENSAIIILTIDKEGNLTNCYLSEPSPDEGFNNSLIEAAKKAKFGPLPSDVKEESVDIDMLFNMQRKTISK